jgi:hypothetical protein
LDRKEQEKRRKVKEGSGARLAILRFGSIQVKGNGDGSIFPSMEFQKRWAFQIQNGKLRRVQEAESNFIGHSFIRLLSIRPSLTGFFQSRFSL